MGTVGIAELKATLSERLARVKRGEEVVITERGVPVARLLPLDEAVTVSHERGAQLVALDEALNRLAQLDPRKSKIAEMKYFGGLTAEEIGNALGVSEKTVLREWRLTKAWLQNELA